MKKQRILIKTFIAVTLLAGFFLFQNFVINNKRVTQTSVTDIDVNSSNQIITINLTAQKGRYEIATRTSITDAEKDRLRSLGKDKYVSLQVGLQIDQQPSENYYAYLAWDVDKSSSYSKFGIFDLSEGSHTLKFQLPPNMTLIKVSFRPYTPPAVPASVQNYYPSIIPPADHPRLWVNANDLAKVRNSLEESNEHKIVWNDLKTRAVNPDNLSEVIDYTGPIDKTTFDKYERLETRAILKAFVHLMDPSLQGMCKNAEKKGAIDLILNHLKSVKYSNVLDVTRHIGHTIYATALTYDWCFDQFSASEKNEIFVSVKKLLEKMEIGWPPFLQPIVIGHGNELQINRDLLSFAIAFYERETETDAYKYVSYRILKELVPLRKFQYQSPRHNQGYGYGNFRFGIELGLANMFLKMSGREIFDSNIKEVFKSFQYLHVPNSIAPQSPYYRFYHLDDGDGEGTNPLDLREVALFAYTYSGNPDYKTEFSKIVKSLDISNDFTKGLLRTSLQYKIRFLLLDNPQIETKESIYYPLTKSFGPILGSMVSRTGWDFSGNSSDVIAEIKGGGYCFNNHQLADAGSIQIFYKGFLAGSVSTYGFAGTDYDMGFNRRSISKSLMRVIDSEEVFPQTKANDGGVRCGAGKYASTVSEILDPNNKFANGEVISSWFGNDLKRPDFSYFSVDLKSAYSSGKIDSYVRSYTFLNLSDEKIVAPKGIIILLDHLKTNADKGILPKIWQLNTMQRNVQLLGDTGEEKGFQIVNTDTKAKLNVKFLLPQNPNLKILGPKQGESFSVDAHTVETGFEDNSGLLLTPPGKYVQNFSSRITATENETNIAKYLSVLQIGDESIAPLNATYVETEKSYVVHVGNRIVSLSKDGSLIRDGFSMKVPSGNFKVLVTGLNPGPWVVSRVSVNGLDQKYFNVKKGENALSFISSGGNYTISQKVCTVTAIKCPRMGLKDNVTMSDIVDSSLASESACLDRAYSWYRSCAKDDPENLRYVKVRYHDLVTGQKSAKLAGQGCLVTASSCPRMGFQDNETKVDWLSQPANFNSDVCTQRTSAWYGSCTRIMSQEEKNNFRLNVHFYRGGIRR